jgi:hypothetical protein
MKYRTHWPSALVFLALVSTAPAWPGSGSSGPAASPAGVVLRFHNGSVVQPAVLLDAVEIETKLGKLSIPAGEVRRIDFGFRLSEEDARKIEDALRELGSEKHQAREAATKSLTRMGRLAYPALLEARKGGGDLETTTRVEIVLKAIRARVSPERLQTRRSDLLRTSDSVVAGKIISTSLRVRCELFGEVKIPVAQMRELRSLLPGDDLEVAVDASKHGNKTGWMETEFEVSVGTRLDISATGEINLDPLNRLGGNNLARAVRPDGTPQLTSNDESIPGKLLARIGSDGPSIVIGSRYTGNPTREGKLFLRIVTLEHANNIRAEGCYQVKISAEPQ